MKTPLIGLKLLFFLFKALQLKANRLLDLLALVSRSPRPLNLPLDVTVKGRNIFIGNNTIIEGGTLLEIFDQRLETEIIKIGDSCEIRRGAQLRSWLGSIIIGNHCSINANTLLYGTGGIVIGNQVRIAANCLFVASQHNYEDVSRPICQQGYTARGILIEDEVWIGAGVCILDGVTVGRGSVIGAGAVVRHDIEAFTVYAGVPAKKIKHRI